MARLTTGRRTGRVRPVKLRAARRSAVIRFRRSVAQRRTRCERGPASGSRHSPHSTPVAGAHPKSLTCGDLVPTVFPSPPRGDNGERSGSRRHSLLSPRSRRDASVSGDQRLPLGSVPPAKFGLTETRRVGWIPAPPRNDREAGEYLPPVRHRQRASWPTVHLGLRLWGGRPSPHRRPRRTSTRASESRGVHR
jgi:hypothetical protein